MPVRSWGVLLGEGLGVPWRRDGSALLPADLSTEKEEKSR